MANIKIRARGFTIIELMIAIAIVGILLAIAIPAYQNHLKRASVTEGIVLASTAKNAVAQYYQATNSLPTSNTMAGLVVSTSIVGSDVSSVSVGALGTITVTYTAGNVGTSALTLTLTPSIANSGSITWVIGSSGTTGVPQKWCPTSIVCAGTGS